MSEIQFNSEKIRAFIKKNTVVFDEEEVEIRDDTNIFKSGYVNSMFAMMLLTFLESEFKVTIADEDIVLPNFSSIDSMRALVERVQGVAKIA